MWIAAFENPVTVARGQEAIVDLFLWLLLVVPGKMIPEFKEICSSQLYRKQPSSVLFSFLSWYLQQADVRELIPHAQWEAE